MFPVAVHGKAVLVRRLFVDGLDGGEAAWGHGDTSSSLPATGGRLFIWLAIVNSKNWTNGLKLAIIAITTAILLCPVPATESALAVERFNQSALVQASARNGDLRP